MINQMRVDPGSYIPVTLQLKEQVKELIRRGALAPGMQLPSVRELAGFLRINRNTVVKALADLEREGYVRTHHGKGVFVADRLPDVPSLESFLDETLGRARTLGLNAEALALALLARAQLGETPTARARVLLLECSHPTLRLYRRNLEEDLGVEVESVLLKDLPALVQEPDLARRYAVAVTTFFHIEEAEAALAPRGLKVMALLPEASLETLLRLMRLPKAFIGAAATLVLATLLSYLLPDTWRRHAQPQPASAD